jgi:hypothetical protein
MEEIEMNIKSRVVTTAVFAASISLMSVAVPANAAVLTALDVGQGTLLDRGMSVDVPVTLVCDPGSVFAQVSVQVNQRVSQGRITRGFGTTDVTCTGQSQIVTVNAPVSAPVNILFKNGTAVAEVFLIACDLGGTCDEVRIRPEIFLKNH